MYLFVNLKICSILEKRPLQRSFFVALGDRNYWLVILVFTNSIQLSPW